MKRLFCGLFLVASAYAAGCTPPVYACGSDADCSPGNACSAGSCIDVSQPDPELDGGIPPQDAGTDAGFDDAGEADAGETDAGPFDAGEDPDAGEPDAGVDAGPGEGEGEGEGEPVFGLENEDADPDPELICLGPGGFHRPSHETADAYLIPTNGALGVGVAIDERFRIPYRPAENRWCFSWASFLVDVCFEGFVVSALERSSDTEPAPLNMSDPGSYDYYELFPTCSVGTTLCDRDQDNVDQYLIDGCWRAAEANFEPTGDGCTPADPAASCPD
ncbi:hypothetical protein EPO34_00010 [Patescibacteria group bacterium]|nr:MAG: hypothetical protein EPO34_00010 [Patescibacteria group bacterium]